MSGDYSVALSRFGMSIPMFLGVTPLEFFNAIQDQEKVEILKMQPMCEAIRSSTLYLLNAQLKKRIRNPKKLWSFPWDDENIVRQSPEQMKGVMRAIATGHKSRKRRKRVDSTNLKRTT